MLACRFRRRSPLSSQKSPLFKTKKPPLLRQDRSADNRLQDTHRRLSVSVAALFDLDIDTQAGNLLKLSPQILQSTRLVGFDGNHVVILTASDSPYCFFGCVVHLNLLHTPLSCSSSNNISTVLISLIWWFGIDSQPTTTAWATLKADTTLARYCQCWCHLLKAVNTSVKH